VVYINIVLISSFRKRGWNGVLIFHA